MIIKLNIAGTTPIRLALTSELTQQLHVSRKKDEYDRRITTSWITGTTTVTLERNHSNKNSKDVDGLIYIGRSFQQYMDKFDAGVGFRLAGVRAFAKFFAVNGKSNSEATKLAEQVMDTVVANKDKDYVTFGTEAAKAPAKAVAAKKRGRKAKTEKVEKAETKTIASPARKRGRPRKQPV
jgi:hypothetical protein